MTMTTANDSGAQQYPTSDLGCATALVVVGIELISLDRSNPRRVVFVFSNTSQLSARVEAYWSGRLSVDAKAYFEALKWLKARVYNG